MRLSLCSWLGLLYSCCGGVKVQNIRAIVREGRIELLEEANIPEGTEVLVTTLPDEFTFWLNASESWLDSVWDNAQDDVYAELLEK